MVSKKLLGAVSAAALSAGLGLALPASASSPGCAFGNGCATLHGFDAASHPVAMDAKYQNKHEILIGYPDNPGDGASSFDGALHFTPNGKTVTYQDTGFTFKPSITTLTCGSGSQPSDVPTLAANTITATGSRTFSNVTATGGVTFTENPGHTTVTPSNSATGTLVIDEPYNGSDCIVAYTFTVTAGVVQPGHVTDDAQLTLPTSSGGSQFAFHDADTGGQFGYTAIPAGITPGGADNGTWTANTSTAIPNTYTNLSVFYTAPSGAKFTVTFTLVVDGNQVTNKNPDKPYYTFVYAPNGTWTSQCVTDVNGSGALKLEQCTLGKDKYQDFFALDGSGTPVQIADGVTTYHFQNWLASVANAVHSCLTDPSSLNPGTPQSDVTDKAPGGRQLRTDGNCGSSQNLWSWNT